MKEKNDTPEYIRNILQYLYYSWLETLDDLRDINEARKKGHGLKKFNLLLEIKNRER